MNKRKLCALITAGLLLTSVTPAFAATQSTALSASSVTVVNNYVGTKDTITVNDLNAGDVITVYKDGTTSATWGTVTADGQNNPEIDVDQLGQTSGKVYVTLKDAAGDGESTRTEVAYTAETTPAADKANVVVANNVGKADTVTVKSLKAKDVVKVYAADGSTLLGSATASADGDVKVTLGKQLDETALDLKVTVKSGSALESDKTDVTYSAEAVTTAPDKSNIVVVNNVTKADTVTVKSLKAKDVVKVYAKDGSTVLGTATASADGDVTVTLAKQLDETALDLKVTVKSDNQRESTQTDVTYSAEAVTTAPDKSNITVTNNVTKADTVAVKSLKAEDKVTVYAADGKTVLGTTTVAKDGDVTISLAKQLDETALDLKVTVKSDNQLESTQTDVTYSAEVVTTASDKANIVVVNNVGKSDTITVKGCKAKDIVKIYAADGKTVLGTATAAKDGDVIITLAKQLDETALDVKVTVKSDNQLESTQTDVTYSAEVVTTAPDKSNVVVANNVGKSDTVTVKGCKAKDIVKVYAADGKTVLGTATAAKDGDVTITLAKQLDETALDIKVTVKSDNQRESAQTDVTYSAEVVTTAPDKSNIVVANNVGKADTVTVKGCKAKDIVKIYAADGKTVLGTATAAKDGDVTITLAKQLDETALDIKVTVKSDNQRESAQTDITYSAEVVTDKIDSAKIVAVGTGVMVTGVTAGDIVKIYDGATGSAVLGTATVGKGQTYVFITIKSGKSTIYVTNKSINERESDRVAVTVN